jgi:5'-nucleotidase
MSRQHRLRLAALGLAAATSVALVATSVAAPALAAGRPGAHGTPTAAKPPKPPKPPKDVKLQILALNDFHGQLEPSTSSSGGTINGVFAGGAEYLATHLKALRASAAAEGRHSVTVAAGDLIGATPLLSAAFHDEPTIEAMNEMGLDISSVGNHEFDEGWRELVRMQEGGCIPDGDGANNQNSCPDHTFAGADFQYLSANVFHEDTGETVFPSVAVKEYDGVPVGFIGMTLEDTPNIVTKSGIEGLKFTDEVETANKVAAQLQKSGVKSIVVLVHEGGFPPLGSTAYNGCPGLSGPIVAINDGLSPRIDAVITGHTHQAYNCTLADPDGAPRLVTSGSSIGRLVTDIDLTINGRSGDVVRSSEVADNHVVTRDVAKAETITTLINHYKTLVAPIENKVIGHLSSAAPITKTPDDSGESALGNLIADSQKADPSTVTGGRTAEIAFMNPGGIRTDLTPTSDGSVTYGAAFAVQPFNNYVVSMDMTGAQILTLLQQQWSGRNTTDAPKILQVSGITYSYAKPSYTLDASSVRVNGAPIETGRTYRVVANSFLSDGGDGFGAFAEATNKYFGGLDIDSLAGYLAAHNPYTPVATDRIGTTTG